MYSAEEIARLEGFGLGFPAPADPAEALRIELSLGCTAASNRVIFCPGSQRTWAENW